MANKRGTLEYRSLFWPIVLIGAGIVWLLNNMGVISGAQVSVIGRIWPLFLIAIGLDILIGRQSLALSAIIAVGTVVLIVALMLAGPSLGLDTDFFAFNIHLGGGEQIDESGVMTRHVDTPAEGIETASVRLHVPVEAVSITALPSGAANAFEADLEYIDVLNYRATGNNGRLAVELDERVMNKSYVGADPLTWDVRLSQDIPTDLDLEVSSGSIDADLSALNLSELALDVSSGSMTVQLPDSDRPFDGSVEVSSGNLSLSAPDGSGFQLTSVDVSSGSAQVTVGDGVSFTANVDVSSGSAVIDLPDDAPVQVIVDRVSSGSVNVPASYTRTAGDPEEDEGTWESASFSGAARPIVLHVSVSSGSASVR
jgi:hypothetical protein